MSMPSSGPAAGRLPRRAPLTARAASRIVHPLTAPASGRRWKATSVILSTSSALASTPSLVGTALRREHRAGPSEESGRGLLLVQQLADSWRSAPSTRAEGKVVWAELTALR